MLISCTEACSVLSWISKNFTFTILQELSSLGIILELSWFSLKVFLILLWAVLFCTLFREDPGPCWSSVENDIHLLRWVTEPELSFVSHVHQIFHFDCLDFFLEQTLLNALWSHGSKLHHVFFIELSSAEEISIRFVTGLFEIDFDHWFLWFCLLDSSNKLRGAKQHHKIKCLHNYWLKFMQKFYNYI